jgi:hypothetical protein
VGLVFVGGDRVGVGRFLVVLWPGFWVVVAGAGWCGVGRWVYWLVGASWCFVRSLWEGSVVCVVLLFCGVVVELVGWFCGSWWFVVVILVWLGRVFGVFCWGGVWRFVFAFCGVGCSGGVVLFGCVVCFFWGFGERFLRSWRFLLGWGGGFLSICVSIVRGCLGGAVAWCLVGVWGFRFCGVVLVVGCGAWTEGLRLGGACWFRCGGSGFKGSRWRSLGFIGLDGGCGWLVI